MTLGQAYKKIINALNSDEKEQEAAEILSFLTEFDKKTLFLNFDKSFFKAEQLENIISERTSGKPLAYILNNRSFYGYDFYVDERCLIPRYDSECLVESALSLICERGYERILDLCSGSGCLGISVEKECRENLNIHVHTEFSDISKEAMEVCLINAGNLLNCRPKHYIGDLYIEDGAKYDLIICNPPYIDYNDAQNIDAQVLNYEPHTALFAAESGVALYPEIIKKAYRHLSGGGALICEIGCNQADIVKRFFLKQGFKNVRGGRDLALRDRFICGEK